MIVFTRAGFTILLVVAAGLVGAAGECLADEQRSAPAGEDATANRIREAWSEIQELLRSGRTAEAEQRREELAREFFGLYLANPEARSGQQALATAFRMWGQSGDHASIEAAIQRVDRGSTHWVQLIRLARPAFTGAGRLDDYRTLVGELAAELTDPRVASEVWLVLGRDYRSTADAEPAAACFERVIALEADAVDAEAARVALHALGRLSVGSSAPRFEAIGLDGSRVSLDDHTGRFVLLEFWSGDCESCLSDIDHLRWVRAAYPPDQLSMIGVLLDPDLEDARRAVAVRRIDWPQIWDGRPDDGEVSRLYEVHDAPRSFLIDPEGRIVARDVAGDELDALLVGLMPGPRGTPQAPRTD